MPSNAASWLLREKVKPLQVDAAPYIPPGPNEIVVKNYAVAVNPIDWKLQDLAVFPLQYPCILGSDISGQVVEVGSSISRFRKGDRVLGHSTGPSSERNIHAGFQLYSVLLENMASPIPDTLDHDQAVVIPLGLSTAAAGLFQKDYLELRLPKAKPTRETILIWGGSSSVGSNAIQLAAAAGYRVVTTASPRNFQYVWNLGASHVFDYHNPAVIEDLVAALRKETVVGAYDAINAGGAIESCVEVINKCRGKRIVVTVGGPPKGKTPFDMQVKSISSGTIATNGVGKAMYEDFLPGALASGKYIAAPASEIIGKGLEHVQAGLDAQKAGVSARKIVVTL